MKLNELRITLLAILVIVLSISLSLFFNSYELAVSGMLVTIILTAFLPGWRPTLIAGIVSMIIMTGLVIHFKHDSTGISKALLSQVYTLMSILVSMVMIFYLKRVQQKFSYEKAHMTSLFENATEGILLTDKAGKIILVNPAAEKIFGYTAEEINGSSIEILIPKRYHENHIHQRRGFNQNPSNRPMGAGRDLFARRKDGTEFSVEVSLSHYQQRNEMFIIAFIVDITTRKTAEQKSLEQRKELEKISNDIRRLNAELENKVEERTQILQEALQKLEQSQKDLSEALDKERQLNEIKSRFVSMASHEFRTPLSTILSSATLVSKYPSAEEFEKREKHIRRIKESVSHMNELLEDFLSLGRLEEGIVTINPGSFCLKDFTEDIVDEMKAHAKTGQEILLDCTGVSTFTTDKRMLKNILLNLLSNAIKFSPEGKPIGFMTHNSGQELVITIKDKGLGVPVEDQPYLFSTFYRAKNVNNIQGTGLGLPIARRYTTMLNGTINFTSEPGNTVFIVKLPALEAGKAN